jgi:hypothetical protein
MTTKIRPEVSEKNPYWIERHRYYELKHFCMQYPIWKKEYASLLGNFSSASIIPVANKCRGNANPTAQITERMIYYSERIKMLERTARLTDPEIGMYILLGVSEGFSYECLRARTGLCCSKDNYYNLYRRFFKLLSEERQ